LSLYIYLLVTFLSIYLNIYLSISTYISISPFYLSHWLCIFSPSLSLRSDSFAPPLPLYHSISLYLSISI
jgi:hypothetical protein